MGDEEVESNRKGSGELPGSKMDGDTEPCLVSLFPGVASWGHQGGVR